jgi:hypothetical protein
VRYSPFPRSAIAGDDALESDEMLAMLYSMAVMRWGNSGCNSLFYLRYIEKILAEMA